MIMKNENKKLSRNRKRRIERRINDDKMKSTINKNKTEEKKKNFDKGKSLETQLDKIKYSNKPDKLQKNSSF